MSKKEKLLRTAQSNRDSLKFDDLCWLAEKYGFIFSRQKGSHKIYKFPAPKKVQSLQETSDGMAKGYQVDQLLAKLEELGLIKKNEGGEYE